MCGQSVNVSQLMYVLCNFFVNFCDWLEIAEFYTFEYIFELLHW